MSRELKRLLPGHDDDREPVYHIRRRNVPARENNVHKRLFRYELKRTKTRSQVAWNQGAETAKETAEDGDDEQTSKNPSIKDTGSDKTENAVIPKDGKTTEEGRVDAKLKPEVNTRAAAAAAAAAAVLDEVSLSQHERRRCRDGFDEATHCVLKSLYRLRQLDFYYNHLVEVAGKEEEEEKAIALEDCGQDFRLTRRLMTAIIKEQMQAEREHLIANKVRRNCQEGLQMVWMGQEKGRGVVTTRQFQKGDYVVEFRGQVIDAVTAGQREARYAEDCNVGCYMFYFCHNGRRLCVDSTEETGLLGRLVNHSRQANCRPQVAVLEDGPHVVFLASRHIPVGEEVTVDYGDRSTESLKHHPWLRH